MWKRFLLKIYGSFFADSYRSDSNSLINLLQTLPDGEQQSQPDPAASSSAGEREGVHGQVQVSCLLALRSLISFKTIKSSDEHFSSKLKASS